MSALNGLPPVVLTIAGTDPSGGAGIQADLRVFQSLGVAGASVITAAIAQNSQGVQAIHPLPPRFVARQIDAVAKDLTVCATKIGALDNPRLVSVVAERIGRRNLPKVVLDPVLAAKDGTLLLSPRGVTRMKEELCPRILVITPNVPEAAMLARREVSTVEDAKEAARAIHDLGVAWVMVKGGHWSDDAPPVDLLYDGQTFLELPGVRIEGPAVRGTGCLLSAAIAAYLTLGRTVPEAAAFAKDFVTQAIRDAVPLGKSHRIWTGAPV